MKYLFGGVLISLLALGGGGYYWYQETVEKAALTDTLTNLTSTLETAEKAAAEQAATASTTIASLTLERDTLLERLQLEEEKNEGFERQLRKLAGTVGRLDKLSKTDEELLQKYSKVYFLNENYVPERLTLIDKEWLAAGRDEQYFHADALPFLERMLEAAKKDGVDLTVVSAYRSFETQADLKGAYLQRYGSGANTFSADQGFSEHQLGTAVDFSTPSLGGGLDSFGTTKAYEWLKENAHRYGFILSYPQGNAYYVYEPWHWRFVGQELASDLKREGANFYDWDQRKIDAYLIEIFE